MNKSRYKKVPLDESAKRIKKIMIEADINLNDLAKRCGWSIAYISMGIRSQRLNNQLRCDIAAALGKKVADLWG